MLSPRRTAAPASDAVSLAEAKQHLGVEHALDDVLIGAYLAAATQTLDGWTGTLGRALVTQSWVQDYPALDVVMRLPVGPVIGVTSVTYVDPDDVTRTLDPSQWVLRAAPAGPYVTAAWDAEWPATAARDDAVTIAWQAGYGPPAAVPAPIRAAILLMVGDLYRFRETVVVGAATRVPLSTTVDGLLAPYRVMRF